MSTKRKYSQTVNCVRSSAADDLLTVVTCLLLTCAIRTRQLEPGMQMRWNLLLSSPQPSAFSPLLWVTRDT